MAPIIFRNYSSTTATFLPQFFYSFFSNKYAIVGAIHITQIIVSEDFLHHYSQYSDCRKKLSLINNILTEEQFTRTFDDKRTFKSS